MGELQRFLLPCLLITFAVLLDTTYAAFGPDPTTVPPAPPVTTRPPPPITTRPPRPPSPPLPLGCAFFYPLRESDLNCDIGSAAVVPADDASRGCPDYEQGSCEGRRSGTPCMPEMEDLTSVMVRRRRRRGQRRPRPECCQVLCEDGVDVKYADCGEYEGDACECRRGRDRTCRRSVDRRRPIKIKVKCPGREPEMYKLCLTQCCRCSPRTCQRRGWWFG